MKHYWAMRKSVPKITPVPVVKSSIKQDWSQKILQRRGCLNRRYRLSLVPQIYCHILAAWGIPYMAFLHWKRQACSLSKVNALPSIKKICIYYVIESFKVSITFTGLKICLTQLWKLARQTQRSAKMNSALFAVIMPGCGLAVLTDQEAANVQARRQATVRTVHLSSLAGVQSSAASPQFHLWKCPFLSFSFKIWQKLPETAVLPINSEPGGRGRNHQTHTHPKTNSNSSDFHGGKSEAGFSGQPYFP